MDRITSPHCIPVVLCHPQLTCHMPPLTVWGDTHHTSNPSLITVSTMDDT
jgi:hypothetical protein